MKIFLHLICLSTILFSCSPLRRATGKDDGKISIVFVQVNDVYEIAPLSGGKEGGMARVATIKKEYSKHNPNTFLVMAGDFLSPSVYNSLVYQGERIRGKQMVDVMNSSGIDFAIFGNHEFDITEKELQSRLNESAFEYISSNAFHKRNDSIFPFTKFQDNKRSESQQFKILSVKDRDGTIARIGLFAITLPFNRADYVSYTDPFNTARQMFTLLKDSCDAVVAVTHQAIEDDIRLARELPQLAVILGGHEHHMIFEKIGVVPITKAHANARSAYIVQLEIDTRKKKTKVDTELKMLDESVALDSATSVIVKKWADIADSSFSTIGFTSGKIVMEKGDSLDAREEIIRQQSSNFSKLVAEAISAAAPMSEVALMNSGSIRLDDVLYPPVSQYDIIRSLPYGGPILEADVKGSLLLRVLNTGLRNKGNGGFIISNPVTYDSETNTWLVGQNTLDTSRTYRIAVSDFLFSGKEANLDFFHRNNPDVIKIYETPNDPSDPLSDIRLAIIRYMEKLYVPERSY